MSANSLLLRKLLANLWARGAALQCSINQESLDLLIVTYKGSVSGDQIFDVENLSAAVVQVKYKTNADTKTGPALQPIGIPHNISRPLPYLALLMELGTESHFQQTKDQIQLIPSPPLSDSGFKELHCAWVSAVDRLRDYRTKHRRSRKDSREKKLMQHIKNARAEMDSYNRYSISVRGLNVYGALTEANIVDEFANLLKIIMPSPTAQENTMKYMRPLERLDETGAHNAWMSVHCMSSEGDEEEDDAMDGDQDDSMDEA